MVRVHTIVVGLLLLLLESSAGSPVAAAATNGTTPTAPLTEHVILFVLEGFSQDSLKGGTMPTVGRLIKEGSVTWSAKGVTPALRLPTMASLITGMPVEKHGITWNAFEFSRGYPRAPSVFDYLDLSGGRDSAIFFMDESLYQLARPEPYTDYQMCGPLKPECTPERVVSYIRQYFKKATSGHGYGHAILSLPHLLVVHLPEAGRVGAARGWGSKDYREALRSVDKAIASVLDIYKEQRLLNRTTVFVTSLTAEGRDANRDQPNEVAPVVPWIASGVGIKQGHAIHQPVSILDTGATVMRTLGLQTYTEWDSKSVEEIFQYAFVAAAPNVSMPQ
ncbi:MAG TPA: alkaline phosphatase family protein [Nitrospira sp.]|nr:alkaline phosphatase family protein [Nitrospira sp.]